MKQNSYMNRKMEMVQISLTVLAISAATLKIYHESSKRHEEAKAEKIAQEAKETAKESMAKQTAFLTDTTVSPMPSPSTQAYPMMMNPPLANNNPPPVLMPNNHFSAKNSSRLSYVTFREIPHTKAQKLAIQKQKKQIKLASALPAKKKIQEKPRFVMGKKPSKKIRLASAGHRGIASVSSAVPSGSPKKHKVKKPITVTFDERGNIQ